MSDAKWMPTIINYPDPRNIYILPEKCIEDMPHGFVKVNRIIIKKKV